MTSAPIPWKHVRNVLVLFAPLWVGATFLFGVLGVGYALISGDMYSARQPLVVRDEATKGTASTRAEGAPPNFTHLRNALGNGIGRGARSSARSTRSHTWVPVGWCSGGTWGGRGHLCEECYRPWYRP